MAESDYGDDEGTTKGPAGPDAGRDPHPGQATTGTTTDAQKRKKRARTLTAIGALGIGVIGFVVYLGSGPGPTPVAAPPEKKSVPTFTRPDQNATSPIVEPPPTLAINPTGHDFGTTNVGDAKRTQVFSVTAKAGTFEITQVSLPYGNDQGMTLLESGSGCSGRTLHASEQCAIGVTFNPSQPLTASALLTLVGTAYESKTGKASPFTQSVELKGVALAPAPKPDGPKPPTTPPSTAGQPATPTEAGNSNQGFLTGPTSNDAIDDARAAFLAQRQRPSLGDQAFASAGSGGLPEKRKPARPMDADWTHTGFRVAESTYPVDMTRIVTMDKPIPAVIKVPIDARSDSRAVAQVERDIYGGDGRTIVIERGSILMGSVGSISASADEKVAIAWTRIQRPDGAIFKFAASSGDTMGRAGVPAHIDNRYLERFGNALLASVVDAVTVAAFGGQSTTTNTGGTSSNGIVTGGTSATTLDGRALATQALQQNVQPLIKQFTEEQLQLPVIRTVPAGTRITVWPQEDLYLRPPETEESIAAENAGARNGQAGTNGQSGTASPFALGAPAPRSPYATTGPTIPAQNAGTGTLPPLPEQNVPQQQGAGFQQPAQLPQQRQSRPGSFPGAGSYDTTGVLTTN